jgi:pilus assembly protein CpaE
MMTQATTSETHVLVLTDSAETAQLLPALLRDAEGLKVGSSAAAGGEAVTAVASTSPDVVVIADTLEQLATIVAVLDATSPEVLQVVILPEGDAAGAVACSLAGARVTLMKPFERQRLVGAIQLVHSREQRLRLQHHQVVGETVGTVGVRQQRPRVIAVHGAKGGVGTTTIACNLASALHGLTGRRVALIDGDFLSGDVGVLCDLAPLRTMSELLPEVQQLDAETVEHTFTQHRSGVHVLLAPEPLELAEAITANEVKRALNALRPYFDYQIVDTPSTLLPVTLAAIEEADLVVLVLTPGLAALRSAARFLRLAAQLSYPKEKILLVANRADTGRQIDVGVIQEQLHRDVTVAIPFDGKVPVDCMNAGTLIMDAYPRSPVGQKTDSLARAVAEHFGWQPEPGAKRDPRRQPQAAATAADPAPATAPAAVTAKALSGAPRLDGARAALFRRLPRWLTPPKSVTVENG